jgi:hypothetical protein
MPRSPALPEGRRSFVSPALQRLAAAALRNVFTGATPPRMQTAMLFSLKKPRSAA